MSKKKTVMREQAEEQKVISNAQRIANKKLRSKK